MSFQMRYCVELTESPKILPSSPLEKQGFSGNFPRSFPVLWATLIPKVSPIQGRNVSPFLSPFFEEFWGYIPSIPRSTFPKFPHLHSIYTMTYSQGFPSIPRLFFISFFAPFYQLLLTGWLLQNLSMNNFIKKR